MTNGISRNSQPDLVIGKMPRYSPPVHKITTRYSTLRRLGPMTALEAEAIRIGKAGSALATKTAIGCLGKVLNLMKPFRKPASINKAGSCLTTCPA